MANVVCVYFPGLYIFTLNEYVPLWVEWKLEKWNGVFGYPLLIITVRCSAAVSHFGLRWS